MVSFVLKTAYHGDLRRLTFESVNEVSFEGIREFISKSYDLSNFLAKYQDEEGDWCTLTAATLGDALDLAKEKEVLRLEIHGGASPLASPPVKRSPSLSSWEMLDLDEDEEMDSLENPTSVQDPTIETNETDSGVAGSPSGPEADDSESDGFLIPETSSVAAETVGSEGDECVLVEQAASFAEQESTIHESIAVESDQEMIEEEAEAEAESLPLPNAPAEADLDPQSESVSTDEKINLILAAFDKNGDGRLNFEECIDLLVWASGELIPFAVFKLMCDELRVQPQDGFGSRELGTLYNSFGTLERDFQAALRKLSTEPSPPCSAPGAAASQWNLRPWMALPLLPICPVAAGALALAATLRNRACQ